MNYGPLLFLAAFFALASSWCGFVLAPNLQVGRLDQTNTVSGATYPMARPGLAREGLDVYRANGCASCHSQQIDQAGTRCDVLLTAAGTNQPALIANILKLKPALSETEARAIVAGLPKAILEGVPKDAADAAAKDLAVGGAKSEVWVQPLGPDIGRGWGRRRSVAADFLFDSPIMLGGQRIGPDLANVGVRLSDPNWQLRHLYWPRLEVKGSAMPPYRFLFEKRRLERAPSPDALTRLGDLAPPPGYEIVPTPEAKALVAYLLSLRADEPLFETPMSVAQAPSGAAPTNAPSK